MVLFDSDAPLPPTTPELMARLAVNSRCAWDCDRSGRGKPPPKPKPKQTEKKTKKKKKKNTEGDAEAAPAAAPPAADGAALSSSSSSSSSTAPPQPEPSAPAPAAPAEPAIEYEYPLCLADSRPGTDPASWPLLKTERPLVFKHIFKRLPLIPADNYYSGDTITDYAIATGAELLTTTSRSRLPVDKQYLHAKSLQDGRSVREARHYPPVVVTSNKRPRWFHVSRQSTGPLNLTVVGAFGKVSNFVSKRTRGKGGAYSRQIEMDEIREFYLKYYGFIDRSDARAARMRLRLICQRSSLNPLLDGMEFVLGPLTYDIYCQIVSGRLPGAPADWTDPEGPVCFDDFVMGMSLQYLQFNYRNMYPGEDGFRVITKKQYPPTTAAAETHVSGVAKKKRKTDAQSNHLNAIVSTPHELSFRHVPVRAFDSPRACAFCRAPTYYACKGCKVTPGQSSGQPLPLCSPSVRNQASSSFNCHGLYHLPESKGKGHCDCRSNKERSRWDETRDKRLAAIQRLVMKSTLEKH